MTWGERLVMMTSALTIALEGLTGWLRFVPIAACVLLIGWNSLRVAQRNLKPENPDGGWRDYEA